MKKSFFSVFILSTLILVCIVPYNVFAQPTEDYPEGEGSVAGEGGSVLPPRDSSYEEPSLIDPGPEANVDPSKAPGTTSNTPVSRNDAAANGFPVGSGYNQYNGSGIQNPNNSPAYNQGASFGGAAGTAFGQASNSTQSPSILDRIIPSSLFGNSNEPLNKLFNQLFYIGLVAAIILAIVMIIRGGVEYMTIDAIASKENGKNRVKAALGGLLLAFSAILILNTINPGLTSLKLVFPQLTKIQETQIESGILSAVNSYSGVTPEQIEEMRRTGKIPEGISPAGQKILAEALNSIQTMKTGTKDGVSYVDQFFNNTENGNKACAAAVNRMVELATGQQVGGGLSTAAMNQALQNNSRFQLIEGGYGAALPGDIIISPTDSNGTGHVGIVATQGAGQIISNSSSQKEVRQNHSASSWTRAYGNKGLKTYIYRPL